MTATVPTDEQAETRPRAVLGVLLLASTLTVMTGAILTPVLDAIRTDLGATGTQLGLIITAHGLAIAVSSPLIGAAIDRSGVRFPLGGGLVLYGLAGSAGVVVESYVWLIVSRIVFGVAAAVVFAGTTVALLALYRDNRKDRVMGWRSTAISAGGVIWPLLAGAVGSVSWHAPFAIYLVGVPLGVAALLVLPNTGREARDGDGGQRILPALRRHPVVPGIYVLMLLSAILLYGIAVFIPLRLAEIGIRKPLLVAIIGVNVSVAMSLIGLGYARLRAATGYPTLLLGAAVLWVASFLLLARTDVVLLVVLALALFGAGMGLAVPASTVLVGDTLPVELRGRGMALLGTVTFTGQFLSPLVLGPVVDAASVTVGFLACAGLCAAMVLALALPGSRAAIAGAGRGVGAR